METTIYAVVSRKQYADGTYGVLTHSYNRRMEKIADRLRRLMVEQGISQYRLWKESGVSQPTIKRILDGDSKEPDKSTVAKLAAALNCSYGWLYDGNESGAEIPSAASVAVHDNSSDLDPESYVWIDRYDIKLSAGNGNANWVIKEKDPISFRRAWFTQRRLSPDQCKAMYVRGRSMEPVLNDWDTVLINTADTDELVDGEVYAAAYKGSLYIKTVERTGNGIRLKSENSSFESIEIQGDDLQKLHILGKKVWRAG